MLFDFPDCTSSKQSCKQRLQDSFIIIDNLSDNAVRDNRRRMREVVSVEVGTIN